MTPFRVLSLQGGILEVAFLFPYLLLMRLHSLHEITVLPKRLDPAVFGPLKEDECPIVTHLQSVESFDL